MRILHTSWFTFLILLLTSFTGLTQSFQPIDSTLITNPKIGLVLSGGGALGLAHIGVLKVLEEKGIKPDFIVGTSMGSIVGGLYALGYSASEIESFMLHTNWDVILSRSIPLHYVLSEEKYDYGRYLIQFPFKNGKPKLPSGLIEGQLLTEDLISHTWSAINYNSFDEFPIPFRCIGTDVSNGKEIVFKEGSLARAMRASMAIPTVFTPVNMDSTLVVDGGVVNNFPVDVAKEMGADYIIGIDVTSGYHEAYDIDNMVSILYQISMFPSLEKLEANKQITDVYIHPDVSNFAASDFNKADQIIASGVEIAQLQESKIDSFIHSINYNTQPIVRQVPPHLDSIQVSSIQFHSSTADSSMHLIEKLARPENSMVNIADYKKDLRLLFGTLKYKSISYWASPQDDTTSNSGSSYKMNVQVEENSNTKLKVGIHYDNTFGFGLITNLTSYNFLVKNSRIRLITDLSENFKVDFEWLKYMGKNQNFAFVSNYKFYSLEQPTYSKGQLDGYQQNNISFLELKIQTNRNLNRNFAAGYFLLYDGSRSKIGNQVFQNFKTQNTNHILFVQFQKNTLNRNYHPTHGHQIFLRGDLNFSNHMHVKFPNDVNEIFLANGLDTNYFNESEFNQLIQNELLPEKVYGNLIFKYQQHFSIASKLNAITNISTAITFDQDDDGQLLRGFNVGGNVNLFYYDFKAYGLRYAEDLTNNVGILRADIQYSPFNKFYVYAGANVSWFSNSGFRINSFSNDLKTFTADELLGYGFNLAYLSPIGPIEVGASWNSEDPYTRWSVLLGFQF